MHDNSTGFWQELKRREVVKTLTIYAAAGFALLEGIGLLAENLGMEHAPALNRLLSFAYLLGFPACAFLAWYFDITRAGIRAEAPGTVKLGAGITGSLAVVIAGSAALHLMLPLPEQSSTPAAYPAEELPNSVVVLPFDNVGGNEEDDFFSDGVADEILARLSQFSQLNVIGRRTSFALKGSTRSAAEITALLGVRYLLQGGIRQAGNRIRVSAQLVDASGVQVWSDVYERELHDVFAIQEEIADTVASSVVPAIARVPGASYEPVLEAYNHYVAGKQLVYLRRAREAIEELRKAVTVDPEFAEAWAELAISQLFGTMAEGEDAIRSAQACIDRATELDPDLPRAILAQGFLYLQKSKLRDWEAAESLIRQALELAPNDGDASLWLGNALALQGRHREAWAALERGLRLDPLHPALTAAAAQNAMREGEWQRAESILLRMRSVPNPSRYAFLVLRILYLQTGQYVKLHEVARQEALMQFPIRYFGLGLVYGLIGDGETAAYWLDRSQLDARATHGAVPFFDALVPAWQGDYAGAVAFFQSAMARQGETIDDLSAYQLAWLGSLQATAGQYRDAIATLELLEVPDQFVNLREDLLQDGMAGLLWAYLQSGEGERGREFHRELVRSFDSQLVEGEILTSDDLFFQATLHAIMEDREAALEHLQLAIDQGWRQYYLRHHDPRWSALYDDPRYQSMMAAVKADVDQQAAAIRAADKAEDFAATLNAAVRARQKGTL